MTSKGQKGVEILLAAPDERYCFVVTKGVITIGNGWVEQKGDKEKADNIVRDIQHNLGINLVNGLRRSE